MSTGIATQKIMMLPWFVMSALYTSGETNPNSGTLMPG
jgi:hypothetical protein